MQATPQKVKGNLMMFASRGVLLGFSSGLAIVVVLTGARLIRLCVWTASLGAGEMPKVDVDMFFMALTFCVLFYSISGAIAGGVIATILSYVTQRHLRHPQQDGTPGWARIRSQGIWRYCFLNGVLAFGLPIFIVQTFVVFGGEGIDFPVSMSESALLHSVLGMMFGHFVWKLNEGR